MRIPQLLPYTTAFTIATVLGCGAAPSDTSNTSVHGASAAGPASETTGHLAQADTSDTTPAITAKTVADWAGYISNYYGAFQAADAVAQAMGLLQDPNQDILNELRALHDQIDQVAGSISWFMAETERENRLADLRSAVLTTNDGMSHGPSIDWSSLDLTTAQTVAEGTVATAFERYYVDSQTNGAPVDDPFSGSFTWKSVISYSKSNLQYHNGYVYDWRLGLPSLLQLVALRLQLMAMEDQSFTSDGRFHDELMSYHDALQGQLSTMRGGIRCNVSVFAPVVPQEAGELSYPNWRFWLSCADIYSGLNVTKDLLFGDSYPLNVSSCSSTDDFTGNVTWDNNCLNQANVDYGNWYQANVQTVVDQAQRDVGNMQPWFGVQALIDTLYVDANAVPELTTDLQVHSAADPSLCLDVPGGNINSQTQVQIYSCDGDVTSQAWLYDRQNQAIVELFSGLCLDVQYARNTPGTIAWTYSCNGTDAQRWSYSAETQALTNKRGNVLDIPWDNVQSGQALWTWPANGTDAQRWQ